jgi:heptosyltransferase-1
MTKILIVRLGALGDILHALPAVTAIRAALPEAIIGWIVEQRFSPLLGADGKYTGDALSERKPVVNTIHTVDTIRWRRHMLEGRTVREMRGSVRRLRSGDYDIALDLQGNVKSAVCARASGAKQIVGFTDPRESAARWFYDKKFSRPGRHVIEQNFAAAAEALKPLLGGRRMELAAPRLPCDPASQHWASEELTRLGIAAFAMVTPGAGWQGKQWPPERFGLVAQALAKHNLRTLVNTGPGEEGLAAAVAEASRGAAMPVRCSIGQLIALTRRAKLFVGGDTGPLHLAAALGIPVVWIFGPTDPARTGPFGTRAIALRHTESRTTFSHHRSRDEGLLRISADEVIAAARHLLGGGDG